MGKFLKAIAPRSCFGIRDAIQASDTPKQYLATVMVVVCDNAQDIDTVDAALEDIRGVGSAEVVELTKIGPDDSRYIVRT